MRSGAPPGPSGPGAPSPQPQPQPPKCVTLNMLSFAAARSGELAFRPWPVFGKNKRTQSDRFCLDGLATSANETLKPTPSRPRKPRNPAHGTTSPRFQPMWPLPVQSCKLLCPRAPLKGPLHIILCDNEFAPSSRSLLLTAELTRTGTESFGAAGRSALSSSCPPVLWVRAHEHECVWSKRAVLECVCQQVGECVCAPG